MKPLAPTLVAACAVLGACSPPPAAAPKPAAAAVDRPAPPAKAAVMICRNSQTGAKAECGTPGAVMVGMKTE